MISVAARFEARMRSVVILALVAAFVVAPAVATLPTAEACMQLPYYCYEDGQVHFKCSGVTGGVESTLACVDALRL